MECAKLERYKWWKALLDLVSVGADPASVPQKELTEWHQKAGDLFYLESSCLPSYSDRNYRGWLAGERNILAL